jgi:ABC-type ATPase involved in cell division/GNAT superfamily N-acetyltransferase
MLTLTTPIQRSFRVEQIAGLFDLRPADQATFTLDVRLPNLDNDWQIGAIVGPSGSGKTSLAKDLFQTALHVGNGRPDWPADAAVIDGFGDQPIQQITQTLTAVGFSSPPAWLRPFTVLSNGEQFRCELARALLSERSETVVCDEFTSTVDRTVARSVSAAVSRAIRRGRVQKRFVAVSCHADFLAWLSPDWILDLATGELIEDALARSCLRRKPLSLRVVGCEPAAWHLFARHHYLSESLPGVNECYVALWPDAENKEMAQPVAFCATCGLYGYKGRKRISRIVVLPDFQGLGIGPKLMEQVAMYQQSLGFRINVTASHPAVRAYCNGSPLWKLVGVKKSGNRGTQSEGERKIVDSHGRAIASFEFAGNSEGENDECRMTQCRMTIDRTNRNSCH